MPRAAAAGVMFNDKVSAATQERWHREDQHSSRGQEAPHIINQNLKSTDGSSSPLPGSSFAATIAAASPCEQTDANKSLLSDFNATLLKKPKIERSAGIQSCHIHDEQLIVALVRQGSSSRRVPKPRTDGSLCPMTRKGAYSPLCFQYARTNIR